MSMRSPSMIVARGGGGGGGGGIAPEPVTAAQLEAAGVPPPDRTVGGAADVPPAEPTDFVQVSSLASMPLSADVLGGPFDNATAA